MGLLDDYQPGDAFCEMFDSEGQVRSALSSFWPTGSPCLGTADMEERARLTEATFRNLGITFAVYGSR